jgi:hypothetical protein
MEHDMSQEQAKAALYAAIEKVAEAAPQHGLRGSAMLRDAAVAYRAVAGGPQPGGVVVESN